MCTVCLSRYVLIYVLRPLNFKYFDLPIKKALIKMRWLYCTAPFFNKPKIGNQWSVNKIGTKSRKSYLWFGLKIYRSVIHLFEYKTNSSKWFFLKVYLLHERNPQKKRVWNLPLLIFFPSQTMGVIILPMWVELYKNRFSTFFLWDFLCKQMNIYVELRIIWDKAKFIGGIWKTKMGTNDLVSESYWNIF